MALFDIPTRSGKDSDKKLAQKSKAKTKAAPTTVKGGGGLAGQIATINSVVEKNLGQFYDETLIIRDLSELSNYITKAISNGVIAIDTETTGLDPMQDKLVGICIYTPNEKTAYVPINHVSYITNELVANQLKPAEIAPEMARIKESDTRVIMFNAPFDIRFIKNGVGVLLHCYWDCYLGARLLNENEGSGNNNLKKLHNKYVLGGVGDAFRFDDLFKGVTFDKVPIKTGALYAAHDPKITYELYKYQEPFLISDNPECIARGLQDVSWVFHNIEMPIVDVVVDMEENGIELDLEYAQVLSEKYNDMLNNVKRDVYSEIAKFDDQITLYKTKLGAGASKLSDPINIASPTQLSILLYDILGLDAGVDKKTKKPIRGTGEDILTKLDTPLCKKILEYRGIEKLISTYIDKLPECVNPNDGRIHCKFNQYGADTGRFSSNDPKQNWAYI